MRAEGMGYANAVVHMVHTNCQPDAFPLNPRIRCRVDPSVPGSGIGTAFYDVGAGGDPLLWSHLFWYFGHPEVYVVIVPAFGVISEVLATSSRRSIFGYKSMVFALAGIGVVAFIVYGHHMFTSGMSPVLRFVTMVTTMLVAVPTGIKIFNWLKTMHGGSLVYRTHTLWALGFLVTFTLGGISGMFFPSIAMDTHLHESYFVVAHFHYVLVGGLSSDSSQRYTIGTPR